MRHLLPILFATGVALGASVPARADFAAAQAAFELGDYQTAYAEFLKLAQAGDSNAQTALGVLYDDGHGVAKDQHIAVMWYQKAAEKGNPQAQLNLGIHYEQGQGIEQDNALALGWYRKAAEQGYAPAQVALGSMYYRGRGVPQDKKEANAWFKKAADQGNASAQQNLANAFYFGDGAEINYPEALKLYQLAAAQGFGDSQYNLGVMYEKGQGVSKDAAKAYFWWLLASARGAPEAARNRDRVEKVLTPAQRAEAQTAVKQWKPTLAQASTIKLQAKPTGAASRAQKSEPDVTGTAFRITPTYYVTNFHVVRGCQRLRVNGSQTAERQAADERNDLALLSVPASSGATAILRIGRLHVGEQVTAIGFPLLGVPSATLSVTSGKLSSLSGVRGDTRFIQITSAVQVASSGAVFDASGNVLGFVGGQPEAAGLTQATGAPQGANFAITANALQGFLDANSVDFETAGLGVAQSSAQVAAGAKDVVALVECWQ